MRILKIVLFILLLTSALTVPASANEPDSRQSYIYVDSGAQTVDPYTGVDVTIGLLDAVGRPLDTPPQGKIFIWATHEQDSHEPSPAMQLVLRSVAGDIAIHALSGQPSILIADAKAFLNQRNFKVSFSRAGTYELNAVYLPSADAFISSDLQWHDGILMSGAGTKGRQVMVGATPIRDVGMIIASASVNGVSLGNATIQPPGKQTVQTMQIPIHEDGKTPTQLHLRLLRANGEPVGSGVPIYITTSAPKTRIAGSNPHHTDERGNIQVRLSGDAGENGFIGLRLNPKDGAMLIPLKRYSYHPQRVLLNIGADHMEVDGRDIRLDAPALVKNGRTYVPYRAIGEILGATIDYNQTIRTITTVYEDRTITMTLGYDHYAINENIYPMDAKPFITTNNRTMVPLRFIATATGYDVEAIADARGLTKTVLFTRK